MKTIKRCFVPLCDNTSENSNKIFLSLPLDSNRRKLWFAAVGQYGPKVSKSKSLYCCEDHFVLEEDSKNWWHYKMIGERLTLKPDVVPHRFLREPLQDKAVSQLTLSAKRRRVETVEDYRKKAAVAKALFKDPSSSVVEEATEDELKELEEPMAVPFISILCEVGINAVPEMRDAKLQTEDSFLVPKPLPEPPRSIGLVSSSSSSSLVISEYNPDEEEEDDSGDEVLKTAMDRRTSTIHLTELRSRFYSGLPPETFSIVKFAEEFGQIRYADTLVTLRKIRMDDVYTRLADDFQRSRTTMQKTFTKTVIALGNLFASLIFWPNPQVIKRTLPLPFRARYKNVQSIIDCFEIEIAKPSDPIRQAISWSDYKKCNTVKFLVSTTPNGFVNYISEAFAGRISDYEIVRQSHYLSRLPNDCTVMADRRFKRLTSLLVPKNCLLVRPPSVSSDDILTKEEAKENKRIAALRIHVERIIRRLREFKMLVPHACLNREFLPLMNHIIIIACAIINVQPPLIN